MSKPDKHIENIYRQRLINAEVSPPPYAWEKIANSLDGAAKNRRLVFYRRLVASAAVIIILLSVGIGFLYQKRQVTPSDKLTIVATDSTIQSIDSSIKIPVYPIQENLADKEVPEQKTVRQKTNPIIKEFLASQDLPLPEHRIKSNLISMHQIASSSIAFNFEWPALVLPKRIVEQQPFIYDAKLNRLVMNEELNADASQPETRNQRWSLGGEISPSIASNSSSSNNAMAYGPSNEFLNNYQPGTVSEEVISAYTGGLAVNYIVSDRLSFQSGLYYFKQGQEIQNFNVLANEAALNNSATTLTNSGTVEFASADVVLNNNPRQEIVLDANNKIAQFDEILLQQFGFIEIPFILKYKILSKKLDIYLLGGINANFLVNNNVFIGTNSNNSVGRTNDINSLIYKSTFGLSFEYPISSHFYLNLSPIIKHQLNPISKNNSSNTPMSFFEYKTGISYRF